MMVTRWCGKSKTCRVFFSRMSGTTHDCMQCGVAKEKDGYSKNQWKKGSGLGRCKDCIAGIPPPAASTPTPQEATPKEEVVDEVEDVVVDVEGGEGVEEGGEGGEGVEEGGEGVEEGGEGGEEEGGEGEEGGEQVQDEQDDQVEDEQDDAPQDDDAQDDQVEDEQDDGAQDDDAEDEQDDDDDGVGKVASLAAGLGASLAMRLPGQTPPPPTSTSTKDEEDTTSVVHLTKERPSLPSASRSSRPSRLQRTRSRTDVDLIINPSQSQDQAPLDVKAEEEHVADTDTVDTNTNADTDTVDVGKMIDSINMSGLLQLPPMELYLGRGDTHTPNNDRLPIFHALVVARKAEFLAEVLAFFDTASRNTRAGYSADDRNVFKTAPSTLSPRGYGAIHLAAIMGYDEALRILVNDGRVSASQPDGKGKTPLHYAARHNKTAVATTLVNVMFCDVDLPDGSGRTPSMYAAASGAVRTLAFLLEKGADPYAQDDAGNSLDLYASNYAHPDIIELLSDWI